MSVNEKVQKESKVKVKRVGHLILDQEEKIETRRQLSELPAGCGLSPTSLTAALCCPLHGVKGEWWGGQSLEAGQNHHLAPRWHQARLKSINPWHDHHDLELWVPDSQSCATLKARALIAWWSVLVSSREKSVGNSMFLVSSQIIYPVTYLLPPPWVSKTF